MRLRVEGEPGELAGRPEEAFAALAALASIDGARADWIEKARRGLPVDHDARFRFIEELVGEAGALYADLMRRLIADVERVLERRILASVVEQLDQLP